MLNATGSTTSATATSGSPAANESMVMVTAPSTEFSTGTQAASADPVRTASSAACTVSAGNSSSVLGSITRRAACSVNVPCGPKYAIRDTGQP